MRDVEGAINKAKNDLGLARSLANCQKRTSTDLELKGNAKRHRHLFKHSPKPTLCVAKLNVAVIVRVPVFRTGIRSVMIRVNLPYPRFRYEELDQYDRKNLQRNAAIMSSDETKDTNEAHMSSYEILLINSIHKSWP
ncbi:hypothetical protein DFJ43DRAFT_1044369 [Lentinula guzmanii]|uniref:Uncharacterized protein n=1 Tax=Lentinula guzmanii TaxID=2804957 RepID=A0AA38J1H3_9AGAR|nr:hypothetical protein DFJ43DRAFT_1044369 [Lentinula guzmanii]